MSKVSFPLNKKKHKAWFKDIIFSDNSYLFIGIHNTLKVGVVRFDCDFKKKISTVSINLNPEARGKRLSTTLLSMAIKKLLKKHQLSLRATIKKKNLISKKVFQKCGFVLEVNTKEYDYYLLNVK